MEGLDMYHRRWDGLNHNDEYSDETEILKNLESYTSNYWMALYREESVNRIDFYTVFNINEVSPLSNKEEDDDDDIKYFWSLQEEEKEKIEKRNWYYNESLYQKYCETTKMYGEKFWELTELVQKFEGNCTSEQIYKSKGKLMIGTAFLRSLNKSEAIKLLNLAILVYPQLGGIYHCFRSADKLLSLVPCITINNSVRSIVFDKGCKSLGIFDRTHPRDYLYDYLQEIFKAMEPVFHPLIRKEIIKEIAWLAKRDYWIKERKKPRKKYLVNRFLSMTPYEKENHIKCLEDKISSEDYQHALETVKLHQDFDIHLAFCSILNEKSKINDVMADENVIPARFRSLDESLIKTSLKLRIKLLRKICEYKRYVVWITDIIKETAIMKETKLGGVIEAVRKLYRDFPNVPEEYILDEKKAEFSSFFYLVEEIKRFLGCQVSDRYLIEGIMAYLDISGIPTVELRQKKLNYWKNDCMRRYRFLKKVWGRRYYEHNAYTTVFDYDPDDL